MADSVADRIRQDLDELQDDPEYQAIVARLERDEEAYISARTLRMMDAATRNLRDGITSDPVDLSDIEDQ